MEIIGILISGIACPLIVYFVISKHKTRSKPSKSGTPDLNKKIRAMQEVVNKPFK